ncbi:HlyD family secretion protein [Mucilaginibacter sp. AW1-7]|uniref:HlyD family secretion protein n=1 Tax=Mucilaginibacter sp. AW1-7 TaxID=3349874 RepID=UPI003F734C89
MNDTIEKTVASQKRDLSKTILQRSELAQELITTKSGLLERMAIYIFIGVLAIVVLAAWLIKYPDTIIVKSKLTSQNAPKELLARQDGRLVRLFVRNGQSLKQHQVIGWLESTASHSEVIDLSAKIESCTRLLDMNRMAEASAQFSTTYGQLGEIQQTYQQFMNSVQQFNDYMVNGFYDRKKRSLEDDILALDSASRTIRFKRTLTEQDLRLANESFDMNRKLYKEKVITTEEYRSQNSKLISKQISIPELDAAVLANLTSKREKQKDLDQLDHDFAQEKELFVQNLQSLKSRVDDWLLKYVLSSPTSGQVFFTLPLQENQYLRGGTVLGYVSPNEGSLYAEVYLPQNNFGKIDTGKDVELRFDAYPYQETGYVAGKLDFISSIPSDSGFLASVRLTKGLLTNSRHIIPFKTGLTGQAVIITRNMRLGSRLYYTILKSTSANK